VHSLTARGTDLAGNVGTASAVTSVTVDLIAPTVTINQSVGQPDPATTSPVSFTAVFSEVVYGFIGTDITFTGTAGATTSTISGTGPTYTALVSGMTGAGTVIPNILAAVVTDAAGNNNLTCTFTDHIVTYTP
jgi:hypothetical protein